MLLPIAMRYGVLRRGIGIQVVYRNSGGGLIVGGLAYAALFALIPTLILVIAGIFLLIDDPTFRQDAVDLVNDAFPAFKGFTQSAVEGAGELAAVGGIVALIGFAWGASGLYLNLTRAMERFFPGERVSGVLARLLGVLLVGITIAVMTLVYGLISPWLVSSFQMFGIAASVFVALVWLRVAFLAVVYGAAMARYRDYVAAAGELGEEAPDMSATHHAMSEEQERAERDLEGLRELDRRRAAGAAEVEPEGGDPARSDPSG